MSIEQLSKRMNSFSKTFFDRIFQKLTVEGHFQKQSEISEQINI